MFARAIERESKKALEQGRQEGRQQIQATIMSLTEEGKVPKQYTNAILQALIAGEK